MAGQRDTKFADEAAVRLLNDFSLSIKGNSFELFRSVHHLPNLIEVSRTVRIIASEDELKRTQGSIQRYCTENDVRDVISTISSVEILSSERLGVTAVICLATFDGVRVANPFPVFWVLDKRMESWRISCAVYEILDAPGLVAALNGRDVT